MATKQTAKRAEVIDVESGCDCIVSGNRNKPKQHQADPHAKDCAIYRVSDDERLTRQDGTSLQDFMRGLAAFFTTATALEKDAKDTLALARRTAPPKTQDEDEQVQRLAKSTSLQKKTVIEHWEVTSRISQFHKRLVAGRQRAVVPLEEASDQFNRLHVGYAEAERRRAAEEQDRLRRKAEEDARIQREKELADLEAEAVAREESSASLSGREQSFILLYVTLGDATSAARLAGYKDALKSAARLLSLTKIRVAIKEKRDAIAIREQAEARRAEPLNVQVEDVRPAISRASGSFDRTTWSAEITDESAFISACIGGEYGIPVDVLTVNQTKLNDYARSLHERLDLWPGVRAKKSTRVV